MLDEFHRSLKERALKAEGQRGRGRWLEERQLCGERYSGYVFTEAVPKEISSTQP